MKYLVTSALPYANGPIHFGHIAGVYLPADIYVRHRKLKGDRAIHISGSDEHGVAIMQNAQKAKIPYKQYVDGWHKEHKELFDKYKIQFDFFGQTSSEYHKEETLKWFKKLNSEGAIEKRAEKQLQCQDCKNFLPDRFVEGECYVCGYKEARGDECPECGTWIDPLKLINPVCKFCNSKNVQSIDSFQWYLTLSKYHKEFQAWFKTKTNWRKTITPFVESLSKENLVDRAITRDLDWGIDVPLEEAKGKKLYVWFDAPIGYVSNTKEYIKQNKLNEDYEKDWWLNKDTRIVNFIGKDNIIFHAIIFPVMSMSSGYALPVTDLPANQYVNLEGKQFSKSKGWYIDANEAVETFGSDALRFYLTSLIPESSDSSFTWKGFEAKINSELLSNIGNFINRVLKYIAKNFPEGLTAEHFKSQESFKFFEQFQDFQREFHESMDTFHIKKSQELLLSFSSKANLFVTEKAPWTLYKQDPQLAAVALAESVYYILTIGAYMAPMLPDMSEKILSHFGLSSKNIEVQKIYQQDLNQLKAVFANGYKVIGEPTGLVTRIDEKLILELEEKLKAKIT
jgi:methionyl-tRNA synthetase